MHGKSKKWLLENLRKPAEGEKGALCTTLMYAPNSSHSQKPRETGHCMTKHLVALSLIDSPLISPHFGHFCPVRAKFGQRIDYH